MQAGNQKEGEFFVGIMMVTSLNSYVKNMEMTVKWKERQEKKNDTADSMGSTGSTDSSNDSASQDMNQIQNEESPEGAFIRRARTAYLSAQTFMTHEETANIDLRR